MTMSTATTATKTKISPSLPPQDAKARVSQFMKQIQNDICTGLEELDGKEIIGTGSFFSMPRCGGLTKEAGVADCL